MGPVKWMLEGHNVWELWCNVHRYGLRCILLVDSFSVWVLNTQKCATLQYL